jgi:D-alanyl-D-alanine carboxypeptidase/D-alanyl-D-alanine-endopeptidase (penicillin-binding protein 4)
MHRGQAIVLVCCSLLAQPVTLADHDPGSIAAPPRPVAAQLARHDVPPSAVSVLVQEVGAPGPLLAVNADVPRNPASVIKLVTTLAALETLGPAYQWRTAAYVRGRLRQGRLDGDLILKGGGDPYLTPDAFWRLLQGLRDRGLDSIVGDVILDNTLFAPPAATRADFDGAAHRPYNALPAALSVNFQATHIHLYHQPGTSAVRVFTDPPLANVKVRSGLELVDGPCRQRHHRPRLRLTSATEATATLSLAGTFARRCGEVSYPRLLLTPADHVAGVFLALWRQLGGRIEGRVKEGKLTPEAIPLHTLESQPLGDVVRGINKWSNNLMSRVLFLTLAVERYGPPGTLRNGRRAIDAWLEEVGLVLPELVIDNGSGLSRESRISARSLGALLAHGFASPVMPEFVSSLAIAGVDGTLRRRPRAGPLVGRARLKTGSLRDVSAAGGYLFGPAGRRWIVVLTINHEGLLAWQGKAIQDALLRWVYEAG